MRAFCGVLNREVDEVTDCDVCKTLGRQAGGTLVVRFCSILNGTSDFALVTVVVVNYISILSPNAQSR